MNNTIRPKLYKIKYNSELNSAHLMEDYMTRCVMNVIGQNKLN